MATGVSSSGIGPLFVISYIRTVRDQNRLVEVNPTFERIAEAGTVRGMAEIPDDIQRVYATAHDITPKVHVRMQAAFQKHTDNAVSKTVNFCTEATEADVDKVFQRGFLTSAWSGRIFAGVRAQDGLAVCGRINCPGSLEIVMGRTPGSRNNGSRWRCILFAAFICVQVLAAPAGVGSAPPTFSLTQSEKDWLARHPVITLAPDPEFRPIEYFDDAGVYQGVAAENIRLLEQKLGIRFTIVKTKNWDEVMAKFRNHEIDTLGAIVATPTRRTFMRISEPLFDVPGAIMVKKSVDPGLSFEQLKGLKVAVVSNYTAHDILKSEYPDIQLEVVPSTTAGLTKVSFGMVDAYVENLATATWYLQEAAISNVHVAGGTPFSYRWGIGIRQDWPEFETIVNKGIAAISAEERRVVLNRWLPVQRPWAPTRGLILAVSAGGALFFIATIMISNRLLRRKVAARTAALDQEVIERRRAEEEIRTLNAGLEQRVKERTTSLEREIEERRKAETSLEESRNSYQMLVDNIPLGITIIDREHRIVMSNATVGRWFGKDPALVIGEHCYCEFEKRAQICAHCPGVVTMRTGAMSQVETEGVRDDGSRFSVLLRIVPLGTPGSASGFIEVVEDITERKRAEGERLKLEERLAQSQRMEAIGLLAGGIAHDFNNIVAVVIGCAEIMQSKVPEDAPIMHDIQQILGAAQRATTLTQGLLAFSRKQIINPRPLDLNEVIRNVEKLLRRVIREDIEFTVRYGGEALTSLVDPGQFDQMLINLAANARDAMPNGGRLLIKTSRVEVDEPLAQRAAEKPGRAYALIEVSDSGVGMSEETRRKIFEPFFTTKDVGKGTGLGLSMVYGMIEQNGGFITCDSEPGRGTTFRIHFPILAGTPPPRVEERRTLAPLTRGCEAVLLAEDNEQLRNLYRDLLTDAGYDVVVAADGQEAVQQFQAGGEFLELAILDVIMPKMNGWEVYEELRRIRPDVRVLFTSGYTADIIHQRSIVDAHLPFIAKPATPREFLQKVREVLDATGP